MGRGAARQQAERDLKLMPLAWLLGLARRTGRRDTSIELLTLGAAGLLTDQR